MKDQLKLNEAIDQLGQALHNADEHYNGAIEKDRVQIAMRTLMSISDKYKKYKLQDKQEKMNDQLKLDNINLIKALLNEGNKKEFNQEPEKVWALSYEFYKFYSVYKDELYHNFDKHIEQTIDKVEDPLCEFPLFCITAFANAYNNYKEKENEVY